MHDADVDLAAIVGRDGDLESAQVARAQLHSRNLAHR
jgi:hypothetical protein